GRNGRRPYCCVDYWPGVWLPSQPGVPSRRLPVRLPRSARISPGNEGRHPKVFGSAAVLQGLALRGFYGAAGGNDKRLAGGHIPFASCCEAWIDIGCAFRDLAELDCGAASGSLDWTK